MGELEAVAGPARRDAPRAFIDDEYMH